MMSKINTIPDEHEQLATLSYWLRCYPFMASNPKAWGLKSAPISERCVSLYPEIVARLQDDTRPAVFNLPAVATKTAIAA